MSEEKITIEITADEYSIVCKLKDGTELKSHNRMITAGHSKGTTDELAEMLLNLDDPDLEDLAEAADDLSFGPFGLAGELFKRKYEL